MNDIDFLKASDGTGEAVRAIVTGTRAALATTLAVDSVNNWPTNFIATIGTLNGSTGIIESSSVTIFKGHLSGGDIIIDTIAPGYTDVGNTVGQVVVLKPNTFWADTMVAAMKNIVADSITINGSGSAVGWNPLGIAQSGTIVNNGNRSYDIPFASTVADVLTPGMRLRIPRTVAATTKCTSLNGTTQYYSKTTPNKLTFTDDFTVSAWVKLSSYGLTRVISRFSGTSGWLFNLSAQGQINIEGYGASNRIYASYQSIPLNKWVHIAASLDMSAATGATYIDGALVPGALTGGSGSSLIQSGNLSIGRRDDTANDYFPGKIAQAAVFSAVLSAATIRTYMSQGLTGTEPNLASAYSFNNSLNDLNTTSPNNLTASGGAVATNADSPFGLDANGVPGGYDFGIFTKVATNVATVQVPEGCAIPTSGGVGSIDYSTQATPFGFPRDSGRWSIETISLIQASKTTPTAGTWYNLTASNTVDGFYLTIPVGAWIGSYSVVIQANGSTPIIDGTLSTSNNTQGTIDWNTRQEISGTVSSNGGSVFKERPINNSAQTVYYMNTRLVSGGAATNIYNRGDTSSSIISAIPAYL